MKLEVFYDKYHIFFAIVFYLFVIYLFYAGYQYRQRVNKSKCMAVGYTTGLGMEGKNTVIRYYFFIGVKKYERYGKNGFNFNVKEEGGKYLVKYVCDKPEESRMYFDKPIDGDSVPFKYLNWVE